MVVEIGFAREFKQTDAGWVQKTAEDKRRDQERADANAQKFHDEFGAAITDTNNQILIGSAIDVVGAINPAAGQVLDATNFAVSGAYGTTRFLNSEHGNRHVSEEEVAQRVAQIQENSRKFDIQLEDAHFAVNSSRNDVFADLASTTYGMPQIQKVVGPAPVGTNLVEGQTYIFDDPDIQTPIIFTVNSDRLTVNGQERPLHSGQNPVIAAFEHEAVRKQAEEAEPQSFMDRVKYDIANPMEAAGNYMDATADIVTNPFVGAAVGLGLGAAAVVGTPSLAVAGAVSGVTLAAIGLGWKVAGVVSDQWNKFRKEDTLQELALEELDEIRMTREPTFTHVQQQEKMIRENQEKEMLCWKKIKDAVPSEAIANGPQLSQAR